MFYIINIAHHPFLIFWFFWMFHFQVTAALNINRLLDSLLFQLLSSLLFFSVHMRLPFFNQIKLNNNHENQMQFHSICCPFSWATSIDKLFAKKHNTPIQHTMEESVFKCCGITQLFLDVFGSLSTDGTKKIRGNQLCPRTCIQMR